MTVTIITSGHLAACPRMVKAADILHASGATVTTVSVRHDGALRRFDDELRGSRRWSSRVVDYSGERRATQLLSGARQRVSRGLLTSGVRSAAIVERAVSRVAPELLAAAREQGSDVYYGGAAGALAILATLARDGRRVAVDFEDAHGLEPFEYGKPAEAAAMASLEGHVVEHARLCTAAGEGVASYYRERHAAQPLVINNVFEPVSEQPAGAAGDPIRMYWFSQTIGPNRGLELAVAAAGRAGCPLRLTVRGAVTAAYVDSLRGLARRDAPCLELVFEAPAAPDRMVALAAMHDVGLSLEDESIPHRRLCAPNKLFVNLAAGLAVVATATIGQAAVLASAGAGAVALQAGDAATFAAALRRWHDDRPSLLVARRAAAAAARDRWRFSHASEGAALVTALQRLIH